jgi:hypothetical protein
MHNRVIDDQARHFEAVAADDAATMRAVTLVPTESGQVVLVWDQDGRLLDGSGVGDECSWR